MDYQITGADTALKTLWREESAVRLSGGFKLDKTNLPTTLTTLPKGALLNLNFTTRIATVVKTAKVYEELAANGTTLKVYKGSQFKVGDIIGNAVKATAISAIDTTTSALYDAFTIGALSATDAIAVGTTLIEATAAATDGVVASSVVLTDDTAETLTITDPEGHNNLKVVISQNGSDALAVSYANNVLSIALASTTASKNTGTLIQAAIRALTAANGYAFAKFTATGSSTWNSAATGNALGTPSGYTNGGFTGIAVAPKALANALNYIDVTISTTNTPSVTAIAAAMEVVEANLPWPAGAEHKASLTDRFMFV